MGEASATSELNWIDATGQAELVASGEVSARELVEAAIVRAEAVNPVLNAIIHELYEEALTASDAVPQGLPFGGVPFLFKDLGASLAGQPLQCGSRVLKALDFKAPLDTSLALKFRQAGLLTMGKTNTPEFGIVPTTEPDAWGPTSNPWDITRSPGGSSGGSAAAVASGIVPVAHANDGGGSIRIPASVNGLVGLKPSRARISEAPYVGDSMSGLVTEFVVARSVRDVAGLLDLVHGPEPGDPYAAAPPIRPYREELDAEPGRLTIALLTESLTGDSVNPEVVEAVEAVARQLEGLGHEVVKPEIPMGGQEMALYETFITRWAAGVADNATTIEMILGRDLVPDDVEPLTWALVERGRRESGADYLHAINRHQLLSRMVAGIYLGGVDLVMTPTVTDLPQPLGSYDDSGPDPMAAMEIAREFCTFTGIFNATGQPAISLPLAASSTGLPIGVQFVAPIWQEDLLLRLASSLEEAIPWSDRRPPEPISKAGNL